MKLPSVNMEVNLSDELWEKDLEQVGQPYPGMSSLSSGYRNFETRQFDTDK